MQYDPLSNDTITAIATPYGMAGVGIIRISGSRSLEIAEKLFKPKSSVHKIESHRLYYGHLVDPLSGDIIDEVLLSYMRAPRSYTREDVIEINSHSGHKLLSRILQMIIDQGIRLAKPGEFTFRAFSNGRIDLTQAEAIVDLINSKSEKGLVLASRQIRGEFREKIEDLRGQVVEILANAEVAIDFPEEEPGIIPREETSSGIETQLIRPIEEIIAAHSRRRVIEGINVVIAGRVNAGKSSLLNCLLNEQKAIVTPIPGTTRDIIESTIDIRGLPIRLMDTAGIRKVKGKVERIGVNLTRQKLAEADLSLILLDQSRSLNQDDLEIIDRSQKGKSLIIINKIDLPSKIDNNRLDKALNGLPRVRISALSGEGIDDLCKAIHETALKGDLDAVTSPVVPNMRQKEALEEALEHFKKAQHNIKEGYPMELLAVDLKSGLEALAEIIGETSNEEIYDKIFSEFCLGK